MASRFKDLSASYQEAKASMTVEDIKNFTESALKYGVAVENANKQIDEAIGAVLMDASRKANEFDKLDQKFRCLVNKGVNEVLQVLAQTGLPSKNDVNVEYNRKVKIPQFVAEWIKVGGITSNSFDGILNDAIFNYQFHYIGGEDIKEWILRNPMKLKNALDNGYEVEEEPKYYVETNLGYFVCFKGNSQNPFFYEGTRDLKSAAKFNDKLVSEAVAELIKGTVEEVNHVSDR